MPPVLQPVEGVHGDEGETGVQTERTVGSKWLIIVPGPILEGAQRAIGRIQVGYAALIRLSTRCDVTGSSFVCGMTTCSALLCSSLLCSTLITLLYLLVSLFRRPT